jgi:ubiquinone/menaquinone biosynthesis C-methylase UbiE
MTDRGRGDMSFDVSAEAYDAFMGRYSRLLSPRFADFAGITTAQRVLDVGSGPGALTGELVARLGASAVTAVDPSPGFVEAAGTRNPGVTVLEASADALPFGDREFDATLAQLVVHFMPDPVAGLAEMRRVTRSGGVVAACVWDHAGERAPLSPFWRAAHELDMPILDESAMPGAREGHLEELMEAAGLGDIRAAELSVSLEHPSFEDWWEPYTRGVGPAGKFVARLDDEQRAVLRERCRAQLPDGVFTLPSMVWAARGLA